MSDADRAVVMMLQDNAALIGKCERLQAENAKLRELVQSFHSAMLCTLATGLWPTDPEWLEQRMRELGVEP